MGNVKHSEKFLRERRLMTALPVLVLPFITLLFWVLGGGRAGTVALASGNEKGLNILLPSAANKSDPVMDKMALYDRADKDSMQMRGRLEQDPYYREIASSSGYLPGESFQPSLEGRSVYNVPSYNDPAEAKVYDRLNALNKALNQPQAEPLVNKPDRGIMSETGMGADLSRLEGLMKTMQQPAEEDSETRELKELMERIVDIQHPERVRERLKKNSAQRRGEVFAVSAEPAGSQTSLLDSMSDENRRSRQPGFFGLERWNAPATQNAITAVVHETQTVTEGAIIKLRLTGDIYVGGYLVPRGHFVYGVCGLQGDRLTLSIDQIRVDQSLFPVKMTIYDLDGLEGIHIPGAISRTVAKESGDRTLQGVEFGSLDPSLGAQAINAGVQATKSFLGRKVKMVNVTVKAGYQILLKDDNRREIENLN
ncbi:conjugative transposon protein TraM [Chitinophaga horti]|uniref:Conjugative transposon protein TraM n=1 Tax=Chitinophaga horti TaxID=2920382 RepID=A0ABY6IXN1_9BACT|nr:conjugative transposon protein TraM [Chitinophaga horti]UYQ92149.1 conjugative transposon protein TraM [Chitinophaga horti]